MASGLVLFLAAASPGSAGAEPPPPGTGEQRVLELRQQVGEASQQEAGLLDDVARARARLDDLNDAVKDLDIEAVLARGRLEEAQGEADRLDAEHAALSQDLD